MAIALTYHPKMYLSESIREQKLDKIKKKLENRPYFSGVFVIALAGNSSDQLEIYEAKQLAQSYYRKYPPHIIGITKTHEEAVAMVEVIVQDCLKARGDCAIKEYLLCQMSF